MIPNSASSAPLREIPSPVLPSPGDALLVPAVHLRERLASRRDLMATRAIHKRLGLVRPELQPGEKRYGHVLFVNEIIRPRNWCPIIIVSEFGEHSGCRTFRLGYGAGPYALLRWTRDLYPPVTEYDITHLRAWWRAHDGEPYGTLSYLRLWARGILGSGDWSQVGLTGTGLVCSTAWAKSWWDCGRHLYAAQHLHWSLITPHMLAAAPEVDLITTNFHAPTREARP